LAPCPYCGHHAVGVFLMYKVGDLVRVNPEDPTMKWYLGDFPDSLKVDQVYEIIHTDGPYFLVQGGIGRVSLVARNVFPAEELKVEDFI
jgi:hypothetical protein